MHRTPGQSLATCVEIASLLNRPQLAEEVVPGLLNNLGKHLRVGFDQLIGVINAGRIAEDLEPVVVGDNYYLSWHEAAFKLAQSFYFSACDKASNEVWSKVLLGEMELFSPELFENKPELIAWIENQPTFDWQEISCWLRIESAKYNPQNPIQSTDPIQSTAQIDRFFRPEHCLLRPAYHRDHYFLWLRQNGSLGPANIRDHWNSLSVEIRQKIHPKDPAKFQSKEDRKIVTTGIKAAKQDREKP